jgi:hypothetical protein
MTRVLVRCKRIDLGRDDQGPKGFLGQSAVGIASTWRVQPRRRERLARDASCALGCTPAPCCSADARHGGAARPGHAPVGMLCNTDDDSSRSATRRSCMHESCARRFPDQWGDVRPRGVGGGFRGAPAPWGCVHHFSWWRARSSRCLHPFEEGFELRDGDAPPCSGRRTRSLRWTRGCRQGPNRPAADA